MKAYGTVDLWKFLDSLRKLRFTSVFAAAHSVDYHCGGQLKYFPLHAHANGHVTDNIGVSLMTPGKRRKKKRDPISTSTLSNVYDWFRLVLFASRFGSFTPSLFR